MEKNEFLNFVFTLDTNIIIYFLKGEPKVADFLKKEISAGSRFYISTITEAELFSYPEITPEEIVEIEAILKTISTILVDSQIARLSGYFKRKYNFSLPDAIVAATSYLTNSILVTRNVGDFKKIKEIKVLFI